MRPGDIRRVVTWQAIAMGVVTLGIGIPAGLILGRVAWTAIAGPANVLVRLDVAAARVAGDGTGGDGAPGRRRGLARPTRRPTSIDRRVAERVMAGALLWARSEIRDGWRSLIVVGVLVAVVTGSVLALAAGASRAGSAPDRFAASTDLAELIVFIGGKAPAELVDEIAADPRVERVAVGTVAKIGPGVAGPESNAIIGQDDALGGYGRPFLVSGRYPEPGSTDEILVSERGALRRASPSATVSRCRRWSASSARR